MNNPNPNWKSDILKATEKANYKWKQLRCNYMNNPKICKHPDCNIHIPYDKRVNSYCSRRCSASNTTKGRKHSNITKSKISKSVKNSEIFKIENSKAHPKKYKINLICPICEKSFKSLNDTQIYCSKKCHMYDQKNGNLFCKKSPGGMRPGGGRGKQGWYKGIWCDSTYELVWVIYNIDHNIQFKRNKKGFKYTYDEKLHNYYPDFILNNEYIEIKGFMRDSDHEKINQFPGKIKILFESDLKHCFEYVIDTYNISKSKLYDLYENKSVSHQGESGSHSI